MSLPGAPEALEALLGRLLALAEASPGEEVCGLVVDGSGGAPAELWPVANAHPEPARAFRLAPEAVLAALRRLDREGRRLLALYHSHPAGGAALSYRDIEGLTDGGAPILPGAELWVVGLRGGAAAEVRAYAWAAAGYSERERRARPFTV